MNDEQAIRELVARWMKASSEGDTATVMSLMTEDVVFMVPGKEPFGRAEFAAGTEKMKDMHIEGRSEIDEIHVVSDWGWFRSRVDVTFTPRNGGRAKRRAGSVLSIVRRNSDGKWQLARDANMLGDVV